MSSETVTCACEECAKLPVEQRTKVPTGYDFVAWTMATYNAGKRTGLTRGFAYGALAGALVAGVVYWLVR